MIFDRDQPRRSREPMLLRDVLLELHTPLAGPMHRDKHGRAFCRGCGGLTQWPCITRRLLNGDDVDVAAELQQNPPVGAPYTFDGVTS